ncbi:hypothetical protein, partial [Megasphaera sp.]|uniref:hypothetical protein n=1 Tax=Megasphaera sp. TaxID=2023260 RepID=UPI003080BBC1
TLDADHRAAPAEWLNGEGVLCAAGYPYQAVLLLYLFEKLPNTANFKDAETLNQYLPWATKTQEKCKE